MPRNLDAGKYDDGNLRDQFRSVNGSATNDVIVLKPGEFRGMRNEARVRHARLHIDRIAQLSYVCRCTLDWGHQKTASDSRLESGRGSEDLDHRDRPRLSHG